jgi:Zn-dependent oligopeptidase
MTKKKINFRDPIVERVVDKFVSRSDVGYAKYGNTLHDERTKKMKGLFKYLNDVQEELMDAVLYIQACKEDIQDLSEEALIQDFKEVDLDFFEDKGHPYTFKIDEENDKEYWHGNATIKYDKVTFSIK